MNKKILIITASIGSGHTQAARALQESYEQLEPTAEVTVVDFFDEKYALGGFMKDSYFHMLDLLPEAYDFLYRYSQKSFFNGNVKNIMAWAMKTKLKRLLAQHQADVIICTHPIPCCAAAYLRYKKQLPQFFAAVITDFTLHKLWQYPEVDAYFVANQDLKTALYQNGIDINKVFVTGIPLVQKFTAAKSAVHIDEESLPRILIMGGGLGLGAVEEAVLKLQSVQTPIKITVVTGTNVALKERLQAWDYYGQTTEVLGYVDNMAELMAESSLLITKPGGLTCSEALAMELPMLFLSPLPGQEEANSSYLELEGAGLRINGLRTLAPLVETLFSQEQELKNMSLNALRLGRPAASSEITTMISSMSQRRRALQVI